ncbi:MAG: desulfoferrodoxin family protein [Lachnospiraceae bacterium]|nr:desulfoferrodoxin family protein [Lachnospiraceae bacterium]
MTQRFFRCEVCGNIVAMVESSGVPIVCCGQNMTEMTAQTEDQGAEKHVPVWEIKDNIVHVTVGQVEHPMANEHYIQWVSIRTDMGNQRKELRAGDAPKACFALCEGEKLLEIYAYCNVHGLWKAEAEKCC